jgi:nitrous oxidase accessory protein
MRQLFVFFLFKPARFQKCLRVFDSKNETPFLFCMIIFFPFLAFSKTYNVTPQGNLTSLTKALELCGSGDTIIIAAGEYREGNIKVTKPVYIKGIGYPVFDGETKYEILSIGASSVIVEGLHLKNTGHAGMEDYAGIKLYSAKNCIIRNNVLENTFFGIYLMNSDSCIVDANRLVSNAETEQASGNGIHLWKCNNILIKNNYVKGHRDGIYFEFVTESKIEHNHSEQNIRYGLHFMFSHNDEYTDNVFQKNGAGVAVMYTKGVTMLRNRFIENWGSSCYGILLKDITDSRIERNTFSRNSTGIYMEGSNRITVQENIFSENGWALKVQASCEGNVVKHNNFIGNSFDVATNGSLVMNTFNENYWDKYEGYDLNKDKVGDVPYHPVSMFSMIVERIPFALMLYRSFVITLLDKTEKIIPSMTPVDLKDERPLMKKIAL